MSNLPESLGPRHYKKGDGDVMLLLERVELGGNDDALLQWMVR